MPSNSRVERRADGVAVAGHTRVSALHRPQCGATWDSFEANLVFGDPSALRFCRPTPIAGLGRESGARPHGPVDGK